jgi:cytoskeleton protein RodZ
MNNQVTPLAIGDQDVENKITELSEDMEVVSPGNMLREARLGLSLSQQHIASKLNFKLSLVNAIEEDQLDPKMPVTFNRGYLVNYAKLVSVDAEDVLASYEALGVASIQRSEMLSFSKETSKQAEHSRVMWISYLIAALFIGLTILWWTQQSDQQIEATNIPLNGKIVDSSQLSNKVTDIDEVELNNNLLVSLSKDASSAIKNQDDNLMSEQDADLVNRNNNTLFSIDDNLLLTQQNEAKVPQPIVKVNLLSKAVFTFKGDCWVNIYDGTNKRIAWGVKKSGYVMTIEGQAPFQVTVGKPELTSIIFNGETIDLSNYNNGNIAKFELPIIIE